MTEAEFRPCPFCGGKAFNNVTSPGPGLTTLEVACVECGATASLEHWNNRPSSLPPGWRMNTWDSCLGCPQKGFMERIAPKGIYANGVFITRVCLTCGHAWQISKPRREAIGLHLTTGGRYV